MGGNVVDDDVVEIGEGGDGVIEKELGGGEK